MSTPSTLLEQLQLAEASYVLFDGMTYGDQQLLRNRLLNIGGQYKSKFSSAQADEFIQHWKVKGNRGRP
jgi:hypothetical protein